MRSPLDRAKEIHPADRGCGYREDDHLCAVRMIDLERLAGRVDEQVPGPAVHLRSALPHPPAMAGDQVHDPGLDAGAGDIALRAGDAAERHRQTIDRELVDPSARDLAAEVVGRWASERSHRRHHGAGVSRSRCGNLPARRFAPPGRSCGNADAAAAAGS
jgi:hypothetical protein